MVQRVFYKRLQEQFKDIIVADFIRNINFIFHDIPVTGLLNFQITLNMLLLLIKRNPIRTGGQADPKKIA